MSSAEHCFLPRPPPHQCGTPVNTWGHPSAPPQSHNSFTGDIMSNPKPRVERLGECSLDSVSVHLSHKFWKHLKSSDPHSHHYKALQYQELSKETCPLTQLVLSSPEPHTHTNTLLTPQDQNINGGSAHKLIKFMYVHVCC